MTGVVGTAEREQEGQKGLSSSLSSSPLSHMTSDKSLPCLSLLRFPQHSTTPLGAPRLQPPALKLRGSDTSMPCDTAMLRPPSTPRQASKGHAGGGGPRADRGALGCELALGQGTRWVLQGESCAPRIL